MTTNTKILVGILLILVFAAGFMAGNYSAQSGVDVIKDIGISNTTPDATSGGTNVDTTTNIPPSTLTESQIALMKALGVDPAKVTITPAMVLCAEASLGSARVAEIKNGATPSLVEGGKLVACYNK